MTGNLPSRTLVVSSGGSATHAPRSGRVPAAPARAVMVKKRRRVCVVGIGKLPFPRLRLQLTFELVEETPVGALGNDVLGVGLDHAQLVQTQCVEADRV